MLRETLPHILIYHHSPGSGDYFSLHPGGIFGNVFPPVENGLGGP